LQLAPELATQARHRPCCSQRHLRPQGLQGLHFHLMRFPWHQAKPPAAARCHSGPKRQRRKPSSTWPSCPGQCIRHPGQLQSTRQQCSRVRVLWSANGELSADRKQLRFHAEKQKNQAALIFAQTAGRQRPTLTTEMDLRPKITKALSHTYVSKCFQTVRFHTYRSRRFWKAPRYDARCLPRPPGSGATEWHPLAAQGNAQCPMCPPRTPAEFTEIKPGPNPSCVPRGADQSLRASEITFALRRCLQHVARSTKQPARYDKIKHALVELGLRIRAAGITPPLYGVAL